MTTQHNIPTDLNPSYGNDHFKSAATLLIEGSSKAGGPGGWFVGGWGADGEGRTTMGGPKVPGPVAYISGRCGVIDNHGGTKAEQERKDAENLLFRVKAGDTVTLHGTVYTLTLDYRGYPSLTVKSN